VEDRLAKLEKRLRWRRTSFEIIRLLIPTGPRSTAAEPVRMQLWIEAGLRIAGGGGSTRQRPRSM